MTGITSDVDICHSYHSPLHFTLVTNFTGRKTIFFKNLPKKEEVKKQQSNKHIAVK